MFSGRKAHHSRTNSDVELSYMTDESFLGTFNTKNSIFENITVPLQQKYSMTSVNSIALVSTTLDPTKNSSGVVSKFNEKLGEEKHYFFFERPGGDEEKLSNKSGKVGLRKKKLNELEKMMLEKNSALGKTSMTNLNSELRNYRSERISLAGRRQSTIQEVVSQEGDASGSGRENWQS
jgi:hypothetical protein